MKEYHGVIGELSSATHDGAIITYPYIEIGGQHVRKVKAGFGIRTKLQAAMAEGDPVTIYVQSGYLCGIKMADGRVFSAQGAGFFFGVVAPALCIFFCALLSLIVIGIPLLAIVLWVWVPYWMSRSAAASLPDAIAV